MNKIRYTEWLIFLFPLLVGLWFIAFGAVGHEFNFFPGDLADARFNNYLLEHAYLWFIGEDASFWNAGFMFPEPEVISYSDNLVGAAPFYAIFRILGADRELAFQCWILLMSILNYAAAYLLFRYLLKNPMAAVSGAFIFAFSIALQSQIVHAQTFPRFMIPLTLWAFLQYHRELKPVYFLVGFLCWVYQMYCGIYLGFLLLAVIMILFVVGLIRRRGLYLIYFKSVQWWIRMAGATIIPTLTVLPLMLPYMERSKQTGFYPYSQIAESLPTLKSFFYSKAGSFIWDFLKNTCANYTYSWDFQIFPGGLAVLSVFLVMLFFFAQSLKLFKKNYFTFDQTQTLFLWVTIFSFLFFIRFGNYSLYRILYSIPGFGSMRALQRIINIELVFFGFGLAVLVNSFLKKINSKTVVIFVILIGALTLDNRIQPEYVSKTLKSEAQLRVKELMRKISTADPGTVLSYEPFSLIPSENYIQLDGMMAAQSLGIPTLNGYSATSPVGFDAYWREPNETTRRIWLEHKGLSEEHIQVVH